jgi:hypothetical protein
MRRVRAAAVIASMGIAVLLGLGLPSHATGSPAPASAGGTYQFGVYYTYDACQYFGNSLVQGGAFSGYYCSLGYYPGDGQYHWYLYVY